MKHVIWFSTILVVVSTMTTIAQQNVDANVISYYAVGNSLDGQPIIERTNVLRFYPVFALRDNVQQVKVTVYYGPHVYTRMADSLDGKRYWQVLLPKFELGEAIQRLEVETMLDMGSEYREAFNKLDSLHATFQKMTADLQITFGRFDSGYKSLAATMKDLEAELKMQATNLKNKDPQISTFLDELRIKVQSASAELKNDIVGIETARNQAVAANGTLSPLAAECEAVIQSQQQFVDDFRLAANDLGGRMEALQDLIKDVPNAVSQMEQVRTLMDAFLKKNTNNDGIIAQFRQNIAEQERERVRLQDDIFKKIKENFSDAEYVGPSVLKSDIIVEKDMHIRILYRNYKRTLRNLPALDPAERLGIFRARYVPFAVVGDRLHTPFDSAASTVFEVGLSFGDAIVAGDDFVLPEFSLRRLGVAFVITNKLFSDSATIRALAFTYDFNSYGSVGIGANFGHDGVQPYYSFGINKKAFEDVIGQVQKLFQ